MNEEPTTKELALTAANRFALFISVVLVGVWGIISCINKEWDQAQVAATLMVMNTLIGRADQNLKVEVGISREQR